MDVVIQLFVSTSTSAGVFPEVAYSCCINSEMAGSVSKALISNTTYDYALQFPESVSVLGSFPAGLSLSVLELMFEQANSSGLAPAAAVKADKKAIIQAIISKSSTAALKPSLSIQGDLLFSADSSRNQARAPEVNINIGYPAIIEVELSTSKSIGLSSTIRFNLLDYISYGDDIYLVVSDNNNNAKIYRGIVRNRKPADRLLTVSAITGDGILSERIIREDYNSQDIGQTAKEIIDTYCNPLTSTNINTTTGIEAPIIADKKTPLSVLESMRREHGINYFVDHTWDVHFYLEDAIEDSGYSEGLGKKIKLGDG